MFIVLEGPDKTGKSTLVKLIENRFDAVLIDTKRKPYSNEQDTDFEDWLCTFPKDDLYILDRHTPSDIAYGLLRGENVDKFVLSWRRFQHRTIVLPVYLTRSPGYNYAGEHIKLDFRQDCKVINAYRQIAMLDKAPTYDIIDKEELDKLMQELTLTYIANAL